MNSMRIAILFLLTLFIFSSAENSAQTKKEKTSNGEMNKFNIDNCINIFKKDKTVGTDAGYQYWFIDKKFIDGRTIKLSVVRPHQATHAPHVHPEDEFFFVLEGKAEFYLDGRTRVVGPMTSLYCPSNIKHGIRNAGDTELKYLVIKKYPQS